MTRRWVCPSCGAGLNAPERMRRDDVRRFCLDCSAESGRLVERKAPAVERRREAARLRSQEKQQAKREREKARYRVKVKDVTGRVYELDLLAETRRALRDMGCARLARKVKVDVRRRTDGTYSGRAYPWETRVVLSVNGWLEDVLLLVYHEAAHLAAGYEPRDTRKWHGEHFQQTLAAALQKRWPFVVWGSVRGGYRDSQARAKASMNAHLLAGGELINGKGGE